MNPHSRGRRPHSPLRLCTQAHEALTFALGETTDPVLLDLVLVAVAPMPDDGHLLVSLRDPCGHGLEAALAALDRARGFLRSAVADAIARRRAPQLSFTIAPEDQR